jgi:hypothetical protein
MFITFTKKCVLCNEKDTNLSNVDGYGIYGGLRKYFHRNCLHNISCDPEHYSHIQVDQAIQIVEKLEELKLKASYRRKQFKEKCKKIKTFCVSSEE